MSQPNAIWIDIKTLEVVAVLRGDRYQVTTYLGGSTYGDGDEYNAEKTLFATRNMSPIAPSAVIAGVRVTMVKK